MVKNGQILEGTLGEILRRSPELENRHVRVIVGYVALNVPPTAEEFEALLDEMASPINASLPKDFGRSDIYSDHD